eukprot:COSAG03_NODE_4302_length_1599_cov_98.438000_2_plen_144_part_00
MRARRAWVRRQRGGAVCGAHHRRLQQGRRRLVPVLQRVVERCLAGVLVSYAGVRAARQERRHTPLVATLRRIAQRCVTAPVRSVGVGAVGDQVIDLRRTVRTITAPCSPGQRRHTTPIFTVDCGAVLHPLLHVRQSECVCMCV